MNGYDQYLNDKQYSPKPLNRSNIVPFRSVPTRSKTAREKTDQAYSTVPFRTARLER